MLFKNRKLYVLNFALVLALLGGMFGVVHTQARGEVYKPISNEGFLNPDGTLKLDDSASASINLQGWDVQLDPALGPVFSSKKSVESISSFAQSTPGEWSALGSNLAGNDGALNSSVSAIAVDGANVYVGGGFTDAGGVATADCLAKWDGANWSGLGSNGAGN